jgi:phage anti-repressor protein
MELQPQNDELFQVMNGQMTTEQEQIFMASHYLYLQHGLDNTKFVVDFDDVWKNVDFSRRDNAKRILTKNFIENENYKVSLVQSEYCEKAAPHLGGSAPINLGGAGKNKETILLTVDCFKNFCMIAATSKAKVIRAYYIKMENIMHEYYKNFKIKNEVLQNTLQLSQRETAIKRHEVLVESNKNKWVVYFCRIQLYDDGSFILKIGETTDIKSRMEALSCDFGASTIVLDVFNCENSLRFERFLHNSEEIVKHKYNHLEHKNKTFSTEAYRIPSQKEYEKMVKFTKGELSKYNSMEMMKLRVEEKRIDLFATIIPLCKNCDEIMTVLNKITTCNIESKTEFIAIGEEPTIIQEPIQYVKQEPQPTQETEPNSTGPIVQIYHKDNLKKVVQVFNSIMEATRDFNYNNKTASFTAVKKAHQNKTIYLDYRWHFISNRQELRLNEPRNIGETVITQERNQGQVAMLNIDKTKIIKVFKLAKDASLEILQHPSAMCCAIKHSSPLNNHYWFRWENVSTALQNKFLESNPLPTKQKNIRGIKINLLHPNTNEVIKRFDSYTDIQKELKISVKKIKELMESNESYNGKYRFKLCS